MGTVGRPDRNDLCGGLSGALFAVHEPRYVSDDGRTIYFTLSLWGPYNVFWFSMDLVRTNE